MGKRDSLGGGDRLARGARSAAFAVGGNNKGKVELKNVSKEGRDTTFDHLKSGPIVPEKKAKVRPLFNRILVRKDDEITTSAGGILIPDTSKDKPNQGTVLAVGVGKLNVNGVLVPMTLKQGERILYGKYTGTEVRVDNETVLMMDEEQVLAVIE